MEWKLGPLALGLSSEGPLLPPPGPSLSFLDHLQLSMCHLLWPLITSSYIAPTAHPGFHLRVAVISRKNMRTSESGDRCDCLWSWVEVGALRWWSWVPSLPVCDQGQAVLSPKLSACPPAPSLCPPAATTMGPCGPALTISRAVIPHGSDFPGTCQDAVRRTFCWG